MMNQKEVWITDSFVPFGCRRQRKSLTYRTRDSRSLAILDKRKGYGGWEIRDYGC
jgi:hypothetical protein